MYSPPVWSIGTSRRDPSVESRSNSPGPGAYEVREVRKMSAPAWRLGTAPRTVETKSDVPGPGNYEPSKSLRTGPKFGFGSRPVVRERSHTPGPGAYDTRGLTAKDSKPPAYSILGRISTQPHTGEIPGPGAYEQTSRILSQRPPAFGLGTSKREGFILAKDIPGPGAYLSKPPGLLEPKEGPKWGFGTSERNPLHDMSKSTIGPGAYNLNNSFDSKKGGILILSRRPDSAINNAVKVPGPGAYTPPIIDKHKAPAFGPSMGSAKRFNLAKEQLVIPGPGNYDPSPMRERRGIRIGSSARKPLNDRSDSPGPGAYEVKLSTNYGPQFGILPRREDVLKKQRDGDGPGPGAYEPKVDAVKMRLPQVGIGKGERNEYQKAEPIPGPGAYNTRGRAQGPKWGFGSEKRCSSENTPSGPGPGAYNLPPKFADAPKYALGGGKLKISL